MCVPTQELCRRFAWNFAHEWRFCCEKPPYRGNPRHLESARRLKRRGTKLADERFYAATTQSELNEEMTMSETTSSSELWLSSRATLVESLIRELHQTERSCATHCRREAARFGDERPARALLALAEHAQLVLARMQPVGRSSWGRKLAERVGSGLSLFREMILDRIIREERSYRGTLLGVRHGIDLVKLLRAAAQSEKSGLMLEFADSWLEKRTLLWEEAVLALEWFDENPDAALAVRAQTAKRFVQPPAMAEPAAEVIVNGASATASP